MLDFADNALDEDVRNALTTQSEFLKFTQHNLVKRPPVTAQYGFCTDVMEHIPPEDIDRVLQNILSSAQHVFFQISCEDDILGSLIGKYLHLSVHPYAWWHQKFKELDCVIHWSQDLGSHAMFYVTAWASGDDVTAAGILNTGEDKVRENVRANIKDFSQVVPHPANDMEVMILGGGPSLRSQLEIIKKFRADGVKLITLNGTYNWAIENGLTPSAQIIVDAREFNARFTRPVVSDCRYLISSQCDPLVLEGLPKEQTLIWHTSANLFEDILDEHYGKGGWFPIPGGSTVMLRSLPLLRMLGFMKFHLFGFDSCLGEANEHHAYDQKENDSECVIPTIVGGRTFRCHPWMIAQASEFMDLIKFMGDTFDLAIYGDGMISHILKTGADMSDLNPTTE